MGDTQTSTDEDLFPGCSSIQQERSEREPSSVSMKSNQSMDPPQNFNRRVTWPGLSLVQQKWSELELIGMSKKTDRSMDPTHNFKRGNRYPDFSSVQQERSEREPSSVSMKSNQSMDPPQNFRKRGTWPGLSSVQQERSELELGCMSMKSDQCMDTTQNFKRGSTRPDFRFRSVLGKKYHYLHEGTAKQGNPTFLKDIYTELYITEGESGAVSTEHEVRPIETQSRSAGTEDIPIKCNDIFKPLPEQDKTIRIVLTKGIAGIGKTVSVQKFIVDWADGKANQDISAIFPLPFRELNLMKNKKLSLSDLLHVFLPEIKQVEISTLSSDNNLLFIFDGLDECRLSLDFQSSVRLCDIRESASVDVLLTNLMKGNLLPSALIWITSRPAAAELIPSEYVDRVTEVRGFSDPQKEEYFRRRIKDHSLGTKIISHLKSSRSLYIMCHIPVFCWISATVLEEILSEAESDEIPKTLTEMYTYFLRIQTNIKHEKDYEKKVKDKDMILKLGKLAFQQLEKGNVMFCEEDLRECGIDVTEASVYSGLCTQIFREEFGLCHRKMHCFVHLSIQEHLAALYVHLSFTNDNINVFDQVTKQSMLSEVFNLIHYSLSKHVSLFGLHQRAVDEALQSKNGHLDLFLRFLLGLSVKSHQILPKGLMTQTGSSNESNEKTVEYIKKKINSTHSPEKSINLFHCLNELGDQSLVEEIQNYLKSGTISETKLSSSEWSAVAFVLLTSENELDEFNLKRYLRENSKLENSSKVLEKLLPVIKESRSVQMLDCGITSEGCAVLTSALKSNPSYLRDLNLSQNNLLGDSGVKQLSAGLENSHCKLEILLLSCCAITDEGCATLASALRLNPSHLKYLNLSRNNLGDSGVKHLSAGLKNPYCKVQTLKLFDCGVTDVGCTALTSVLRLNPSYLRHLDLSGNKLGDSGVKRISAELAKSHCKLEILWLSDCGVTVGGCTDLTSALKSNPSHLRDLNLSWNKLDSGVNLLFAQLKNPNCNLEILRLFDCGVTDKGCASLTSVLRSNLSHLDLSGNKLGDSGVKLISDGLKNPNCKLETLQLSSCGVTHEGCAALTSALRSNPSHLRDLDLCGNKLQKSAVKLLSDLKNDSHFKLERLNF